MIALAAMLLLVMSSLQSCTPLAQSVLQSVIIGTYPAEEEDVKAAERAYAGGDIGRDIYQAILAERKARQNSPSHALALEETS